MPRMPRSIARARPPVWRSRWKRSDSAWRWRKVVERERADRALRDLGEDRVAQLGEALGQTRATP